MKDHDQSKLDIFLGPKSTQNFITRARARAVVVMHLMAILCFTILELFVFDDAGWVFYTSFALLIGSLALFKYSSYHFLSAFVIFSILHATAFYFYSYNLGTKPIINIDLFWVIPIVISAPLVGGTLFSIFVTGIALFSYNTIILRYIGNLPDSLAQIASNNLIEWNLVVLLSSSFTMIFDRYLNRQINESMRINEDLKVQKQNSLHNARLASLGEMAGGIAHEINNPLAIIDGNATLLRELCVDSEPALYRVDRIIETVARIQSIIGAMRKLAHSEGSGQDRSSENIADIVNNASVFYQEKFKSHGVRLNVEVPDSLYAICNQILIGQVLVNLLNNAFDAVQILPEDDRWILIRTYYENDMINISIENNGPRIEPEIAEKIMDPFFTTKVVGEGTGLGLSLSLKIAHEHNGDLVLDTNCPHPRFVLSLPSPQNLRPIIPKAFSA